MGSFCLSYVKESIELVLQAQLNDDVEMLKGVIKLILVFFIFLIFCFQLTHEINNEVKTQNKMLDGMVSFTFS